MTIPSGAAQNEGTRPVSVFIPAFGGAGALKLCLKSLARYAPSRASITILDDGTPDSSVLTEYAAARECIPRLGYYRSGENRGFVSICNWAATYLREPGSDLLLLNSDTEVTGGFLDEMQSVLHLHDRHGVVTPRSNNATIFSVPWVGGMLPETESYEIWKRIRELLPRYQVMPTAVGFCMLVKSEILDRFGLFDEAYSPGYNEENDFVCRINRCGYSAVAANRAYVFHHGSNSFGALKAELETRNRATLLARYPEYERKTADYTRLFVDPVEIFASLYAPHRPRLLFDLRDLPPVRNGTSALAFHLLKAISRSAGDEAELHVGVGESRSFFSAELEGYRSWDSRSNPAMLFDLAFRPFQIFTWSELEKINEVAPRIVYQLLDIIMVRCEHLNAPDRQMVFRKAAELADHVVTISEYSRLDFARFYGDEVPMTVIHPATDATPADAGSGDYVLVLGNAYAHKDVAAAVEELRGGPWRLLAMGGQAGEEHDGVEWLEAGSLTAERMEELMRNAAVVVWPSHYEGFGMPVLDALAGGTPVVALDTQINREVAELADDSNLHRAASVYRLRDMVTQLLGRGPMAVVRPARLWAEAGEAYAALFRGMLAKPVDVTQLRRRWEFIRALASARPW
ncbi:MAG TPA: glycosyltransferase [Candidatus Binatia bacterium]|nr:glycosyltransferase [Candidatus Binatia bacterium]